MMRWHVTGTIPPPPPSPQVVLFRGRCPGCGEECDWRTTGTYDRATNQTASKSEPLCSC